MAEEKVTKKVTPEGIKALEQALGMKLPERCEIELHIRDLDADTSGYALAYRRLALGELSARSQIFQFRDASLARGGIRELFYW